MTQPRFTKRRWRRPERMVLDHGPVMRRKDLGVTQPIAVEAQLGRRRSRRQLEVLLGAFLAACTLEGLLIGLAISHPFIGTLGGLAAGIGYFVLVRGSGDAWIVRALGGREGAGPRVTRLAGAEATGAGVQAPRLLVVDGGTPDALSFALRRRWLVTTTAAEELDELALEGMIAHEIVHLRDHDAAVAGLYAVLAHAPQLATGGAGPLMWLSVPVWPAALLLRALRSFVLPADREIRADVAAAMLTRYPPGIGAALEAGAPPADAPGALQPFWFSATGAAERAALVAEM